MSGCPATVRVGPCTYRVLFDADEIRKASEGSVEEGQTAWAAFSNHETLIIGLNPTHAVDANRVSLIHEVVHCCLRVSGVWPDAQARILAKARGFDAGGYGMEEYLVAAAAPTLLAVLRDNPGLVTWLTEGVS